MTVEERAQEMIEDYLKWTNSPSEGKEELKARFAKHLRDQIEDCAKVAREVQEAQRSYHSNQGAFVADLIEKNIRTLTGRTDQTEGKEVER